jgi:hypothetical protein
MLRSDWKAPTAMIARLRDLSARHGESRRQLLPAVDERRVRRTGGQALRQALAVTEGAERVPGVEIHLPHPSPALGPTSPAALR